MKRDTNLARFEAVYGRGRQRAELACEREVCGVNEGVWGYTTVKQAERLGRELDLRPGRLLLDVGSGKGWPAVYLAQTTGCEAVLTDIPLGGLRQAMARAEDRDIAARCSFLCAAGSYLPFRSRIFDAVVHTDVL